MASKEASEWLGERLAEQRNQVEAAETKLQHYREQNDAISLQDRENIVVQKLGDLNAAVTRAKTDRIQKQAMYNQLKASQSNPASLDTFPAILSNTFIQQQKGELAELLRQQAQLSEKLGEKHPQLQTLKSTIETAEAKLQTEIAKVVQSVKSEYMAALAQEQSLSSALNQQKDEALAMNRKGIEYSVLDRDVQSNKQIYESLLQRAKETGVSGELKASNIRVVDPAERPRSAVTPYKTLNLALAMVGGSIFALGLAFFFEYFDSRIKSPEELTGHLGLAALGMVPALADGSWEGPEPLISYGVPATSAKRSGRSGPTCCSRRRRRARAARRHELRPGRGKTLVATTSRSRWPRPGSASSSSTPTCGGPGAPGLRPAAGAGAVERLVESQGERSGPQDRRRRPVGADVGPHSPNPPSSSARSSSAASSRSASTSTGC